MLTSYCRFNVELRAEGHHLHAGNCRGVVRYRDLVAKKKSQNFFPGVFVGDSRKFVLAKISHYTVITSHGTKEPFVLPNQLHVHVYIIKHVIHTTEGVQIKN